MIYLSKTQSQSITLTLREKSKSVIPYYTFKIVNRNSFDEYIFSPDNLSYSDYYDKFEIGYGNTQSFTGSVILNYDSGEYHYTIYEMNNKYDLNIDNSIGIVENGILIVNGTYSESLSYTESDNNTSNDFTEL